MAKVEYLMFCDVAKSLSDAYILSVISNKISEGQVHVVLIYAP